MLSMRAKAVRFLLKNRHWFKGRHTAEVITPMTDIRPLREAVRKGAARAKLPPGVRITPLEAGPVTGEWHLPAGAPTDRMILYCHGSGFVMGSARDHRSIVANLAAGCGLRTLAFDYSLAPEHPFPAAVEEAEALYVWLLEQGWTPENLVVAGDSAGACIALGALLKLKDRGFAMPRAMAAVSPCTDLTRSGASHVRNRLLDPVTPPGANETYMNWYLGGKDPRQPYASPLFGDLAGLPPLLIFAGSLETLLDDAVALTERVKEAGGMATLRVGEGLFHCYPLLAPLFPEASAAHRELCGFIRAQLGPHSGPAVHGADMNHRQ